MRISTIGLLACGLALSACSLYFEQDPDDGAGSPGPCEPAGPAQSPAYPFDAAYYQQVIWTLTQRTCGMDGCHTPNGGARFDFRVWADSGDSCNIVKSFNDFYANSDFVDFPENSRLLRALDGNVANHPLMLGPGTAEYDVLLGFILEAWSRLRLDDPAVYFDAYVFEQQIQPMLDAASCSVAGCHDPSSSVAGFALNAYPASGSPAMSQNLQSLARYVDFLVPPESTRLYQRATDRHGGTSVSAPESLLAWLQAAFDNVGL
jgi:hypothetical protein